MIRELPREQKEMASHFTVDELPAREAAAFGNISKQIIITFRPEGVKRCRLKFLKEDDALYKGIASNLNLDGTFWVVFFCAVSTRCST